MATIVTVHGTFAHLQTAPGAELQGSAYAAPWWQKDSKFVRELSQLLDCPSGKIETISHVWSGNNSETDRREAGRELLGLMRDLEARGEPYVVIGHSHGGSVISHALMLAAARRQDLPNLKRWVTVGTPFVELRKERFLFLRLSLFMKAAFVASLMLLIMFLFATIGDIMDDGSLLTQTEPLTRLFIGFALTALPFLAFLIFAKLLDRKQLFSYRKKTKQRAQQMFGPRWLALTHEADEAVRGLATLRDARLRLFDPHFAVSSISAVAVILLPVIYFALLLSPSAMVGIAEYLRDTVYRVEQRAPVQQQEPAAPAAAPTAAAPEAAATERTVGAAPPAAPEAAGQLPVAQDELSPAERLTEIKRRLAARRADRVDTVNVEMRKLRRAIRQAKQDIEDAGVDLAGRLEAQERLRDLQSKQDGLRERVVSAFPDLPEITRASRFKERFLQIKGEPCPNNSLCYGGENVALNSQLLFHVVTDEVSALVLDGQVELGAWDYAVRSLLPILLVPALFMAAAAALVFLFSLIARLVSRIASYWLDIVTWDEVKRAAFGNDAEAEVAVGAGSRPVWINTQMGYLPKPIASIISQHSDREMAQSVAKIRATLSEMVVSEADAGGATGFANLLTWRELIHTSYFDVPEFVSLVAVSLAETGAFRPTPLLAETIAAGSAPLWLAEIRGEGTALPEKRMARV